MKKTIDKSDLLYNVFVGDFIRVSIKQLFSETHGESSFTTPLPIVGYLLDQDRLYYYLGDSDKEISKAIKKNEISFIEIVQVPNAHDSILNNMKMPERAN